MAQYVARRLLALFPIILGVTFITFMAAHLAPGDPVEIILGQRHDPAEHLRLVHVLGLDQPWWRQYLTFLWNALHLDFGTSYVLRDESVTSILLRGLPASLTLGLLSIALTVLIGTPLGILMATRQGTWLDSGTALTMMTLYAIPTFVMIPVLRILDIKLYEHGLPYLPIAGWDGPRSAIFPVLIYTAGLLGFFARITRSCVLEALRQDYVRTARAKGVRGALIIYKHVFRNALLPIVTVLGPLIAFLVTGSFVIEVLFNIPGVAFITVQSIFQKDFPVVQATTVLLAIVVTLVNLITDLLYSAIDPRVRQG
jgi:ABC-type dipeptide/oligopeptide/nickel transport system permease component